MSSGCWGRPRKFSVPPEVGLAVALQCKLSIAEAIGHSLGALSRSDARAKTYSGGIPFPRIHSVMNWERIFSFLLNSSTPPTFSAARCKVCPYNALLLTIRSEYYAEN